MRANIYRILRAAAITLAVLWLPVFWFLRNPGFSGGQNVTPDLHPDATRLERDVRALSELHPNRSFKHGGSLAAASNHIQNELRSMGFELRLQEFDVERTKYHNIIARYGAEQSSEVVVVGAHYDAAGEDNPGADDNASGVAGLLELARTFQKLKPPVKTPIEFVAYSLEEPPFFGSKEMGSAYHADELKERAVKVKLMVSLEMIGYYSDELFSQLFTIPLLYGFYPWRGNFIAIVGSPADREATRKFRDIMSANTDVPVQSINAPAAVPGIDYSDHRSYWAHDWPALMITDTAFLRNLEYHKKGDTADRLNYKKMAEVVRGVFAAVLSEAK